MIRVDTVGGRERDADTGSRHDEVVADIMRFAQHTNEPAREIGRICGFSDIAENDSEFVATEPRDGVRLPDQSLQLLGDGDQQGISDRMTERVVDRLEPVQIEAQDRARLAALHAAKRLDQPLMEQGPVGKVRQGVVQRHMDDLAFRLDPVRDVRERRHPGSVGHGPMGDREHAFRPDLQDGRPATRLHDEPPMKVVAIGHDVLQGLGRDTTAQDGTEKIDEERSGSEVGRRKAEDLPDARVRQHDALLRVEEAQALRHVGQGGIEISHQ